MIEEQRRLFFVSISRVKAAPEAGKPGTLILTNSRCMPMADAMQAKIRFARRIGNLAHLNASRFISELGRHAPQPVKPAVTRSGAISQLSLSELTP